jgi:hypothetical protein
MKHCLCGAAPIGLYQETLDGCKLFSFAHRLTFICGKKSYYFQLLDQIQYKMTIFYLYVSRGRELFAGQINLPPGTSICPKNSFLKIYKSKNPTKYLQKFTKMQKKCTTGKGSS